MSIVPWEVVDDWAGYWADTVVRGGPDLHDQQSIAAISTSSGEVVATLDAAYFGTNWTPLYAPASLAGNADVGTMRIVAIQGAAEEYARQGNAVIDNQLWDKFGKEGGE
jgi:hypothetical protein